MRASGGARLRTPAPGRWSTPGERSCPRSPPRTRRSVLEVGCGWGELARRIADEVGAEVTATDLSLHMVELARAAGVAATVEDVQHAVVRRRDVRRGRRRLDALSRPRSRPRRLGDRPGPAPWRSPRRDHELGLPSAGAARAGRQRALVDRVLARERQTSCSPATSNASSGRTSTASSNSPIVRRWRSTFARRSRCRRSSRTCPATIDEPFRARRANSIFVAEKAA